MARDHGNDRNSKIRTYTRAESVVFLKTKEGFGGLSNMAGGFPLIVQGVRIPSSEALYQACRFPHLPEVQRLVIGQASPMTAKMKSKPYRKDSRPDWDRVRVKVMRWCLRVKLVQNWVKFSELLLRTDDRPIVEESRRDDFWGAKPVNDRTLVGMNVLGRLLMELREVVKSHGRDAFRKVEPLEISEFLLFGRPIGAIGESNTLPRNSELVNSLTLARVGPSREHASQSSLFDAPSAKEVPSPSYMIRAAPRTAPWSDLGSYPTMKDSGVVWLGGVPEHWQVLPNRAVFAEVRERDHPNAEMLSVTITRGVIRQQSFLESSSKKDSSNLDKSAYKRVRPGDIAYNKMRAWQGAVGVSEYEGIVSPAYVVQRPREGVVPRYLHYLLRTPAFANEAERWSYGITSDMWSLRPEHFRLIYSCLPPREEQSAIVRFLDYADRRIRRYILAKQKLIKLLEEQRQAIIHRAVTRGLDPNVRLKPSGVEWLGEVPEHWEVRRLRSLARVKTGERDTKDRVDGGEFPFFVRSQVVERIDSWSFDGEAVLTAGDGNGGVAKVFHYVNGKFDYHQRVYKFSHFRDVLGRFFFEYLRATLKFEALAGNSRSTVNLSLRRPMLLAFPCVLPPPLEQAAIIEYLGKATADIDTTIIRAQREIDLLREYRTRMIADVVTGKLDVREAAARLPHEAGTLEPLDEAEVEGDAEDSDACDTDGASEETEE